MFFGSLSYDHGERTDWSRPFTTPPRNPSSAQAIITTLKCIQLLEEVDTTLTFLLPLFSPCGKPIFEAQYRRCIPIRRRSMTFKLIRRLVLQRILPI
jgi:hypothetical protein